MLAIRVTALVLIVASAAALGIFGLDELRNLPGRTQLSGGMDVPVWIGASGLFLGGLMLVGFATRR